MVLVIGWRHYAIANVVVNVVKFQKKKNKKNKKVSVYCMGFIEENPFLHRANKSEANNKMGMNNLKKETK